MDRNARIVATLGPASQDEAVLERLVRAGLDVARLNFSHGTHREHATLIARLRRISKRLSRPVGILQDLQGPKFRVGKLMAPVHLVIGSRVELRLEGSEMQEDKNEVVSIPVDSPEVFSGTGPGGRILLDDGRMQLTVLETGLRSLVAQVVMGGELTSHKGVNLPGIRLDSPSFLAKDKVDLEFGLAHRVDAVAVSFVREAVDVERVRREMQKHSSKYLPLLIAKLEKPEALENLDEIIFAADGVMVARGDLGVELPPEEVPVAQKRIIQAANQHGKLVITATQMLDSMVHNPLPTRAEASDVANAIFDGSDAVMLSAETAIGEYPVESVVMMNKIICQAEENYVAWGQLQDVTSGEHDDSVSLARAARELAHDRNVAAIAVFTRTGRTAAIVAKVRPRVPILAFTPEETTYRRMSLYWGVVAHRIPFANSMEKMTARVEVALRSSGMVKAGQQVVLLSGFPVGAMRPPNMALLHTIN